MAGHFPEEDAAHFVSGLALKELILCTVTLTFFPIQMLVARGVTTSRSVKCLSLTTGLVSGSIVMDDGNAALTMNKWR